MFPDVLWQQARTLVSNGLKFNTKKTYTSAQQQYVSFCIRMGVSACPANEQLLLMYVAHMNNKGLKHSTMQVYLAAVRSLHIHEGYSDPLTDCLRLRRAMKAVLNDAGAPTQKLPITYDILWRIGNIMAERFNDNMLWAVFTLAYFGLLRAAECTVATPSFDPRIHLQLTDISFGNEEGRSHMTVCIKRSKTDFQNRGISLCIGCSHTPVCAVCAMKKYLSFRAGVPNSSPLFIFADGQILTRCSMIANVRDYLRAAGIQPGNYSGHSFRSGGAPTWP